MKPAWEDIIFKYRWIVLTIVFALTIIILFLFVVTLTKSAFYELDYDCADFKSQKDAQREFDKHEKDIYRLDANKDGTACETLP